MRGRTYRYLEQPPLFPFGFGLSYTRFEYSGLALQPARLAVAQDLCVRVTVEVRNAGSLASDEVVQLYVRDLESSVAVPHHELRGFQRVHLQAGASARLEFELDARALSLLDARGARRLEPGTFHIFAGGSQPDSRSFELTGQRPLAAELVLEGAPLDLPY
jgi:beta-glucosidase